MINVNGGNSFAHQGFAGCGVVLVTSHTSGGIVQDNDSSRTLVIYHIHQGIYSGVHKGGITDNGNPVFNIIFALCHFHTV